ncbi:zinc/cadmium resistance protein [Physcia stellaris]|nr:zinc/cadmium resistance protein [Physcia stellaris]
MGEGADPQPENLLAILPFPEPVEIFERIKKNHPQIRITFRRLAFGTFDEGLKEIPKGDVRLSLTLWPELFHDADILVTLSSLPKSPEDCPNLRIHGPQIAECIIGAKDPPILRCVQIATMSANALVCLHASKTTSKAIYRTPFTSNPSPTPTETILTHPPQLGYGSIGRQVARVCSAMGMSVIAYTAHPRPTPASKRDPGFIVPNTGDPDGTIPSAWYSGLDKASLHTFLAQDIDVLLVSVPLTTSTTHLLGKAEFDILARRNAFVSNISRGQILVQEDLIAALRVFEEGVREGRKGGELKGLRGAALDVTDPEPLPVEHELWGAPNCIVTPHVSGLGSAYADRAFQVLEVNLDRRERGEKMINVVDRKQGY